MQSMEVVELVPSGQAELSEAGSDVRGASFEANPPPALQFGQTPSALYGMGVEAATSPSTILLVDDNDDLRYVMELSLKIMGYAVISCCDAAVASAAFDGSSGVDLLLTDLEMPGRSGAELARELSAMHTSLPVMIVSGSYITDELQREMREKGWLFLAKPYGMPEFSNCIQSLLRPRQQQAA